MWRAWILSSDNSQSVSYCNYTINLSWFLWLLLVQWVVMYLCVSGIVFFISSLTTSYKRVLLVEQELLTLQEHMSSPLGISGVRVARSLVLCACFVDRCFSFCTFSFDHCVVCSSSIYGLWLHLWYLQLLPVKKFQYL